MSFEEILIAQKTAKTQFWTVTVKEYEARVTAEGEAIFKARFPKKKRIDLAAIKEDPEWVALLTRRKLEAKEILDAFNAQQKTWDEELITLAETTEIPPSDEFVMVDAVNVNSYPNQTSPHTYARASAEAKADYARKYGIEVEVRRFTDETTLPDYKIEKYGVFMKTTALGWEILQRRPGVTIQEWLRLCWKRGANPRVFNPFLPHGLEEKWGITYQGEYVRK